MRRLLAVAALAALAAPFAPPLADRAPAQDSAPDGAEVVRRAAQAYADAGGVGFEAVARVRDTTGENWTVRAELSALLDDERGVARAFYESKVSGGRGRPTRFEASIDGAGATLVNHNSRQAWTGDRDEVLAKAEPGIALMPLILISGLYDLDGEGWAIEDVGAPVSAEGEDRVGRDLCDVVAMEMDGARWRLSFAKDDGMLRRAEIEQAGETADVILRGVRVGRDLAMRGMEDVEVPRGFDTRTVGEQTKRAQAEAGEASEDVGTQVGDVAPDFTLEDPDGKAHSLSDYRGKVVLLDFWGTWCPPCRAAIPGLKRMHDALEDDGLVVMGAACREKSRQDPINYMRARNVGYLLLLDGDSVARQYEVGGYPTFLLIDQEGVIRMRQRGYAPSVERELENEVLDLLGLDHDALRQPGDIDNWER